MHASSWSVKKSETINFKLDSQELKPFYMQKVLWKILVVNRQEMKINRFFLFHFKIHWPLKEKWRVSLHLNAFPLVPFLKLFCLAFYTESNKVKLSIVRFWQTKRLICYSCSCFKSKNSLNSHADALQRQHLLSNWNSKLNFNVYTHKCPTLLLLSVKDSQT